MKEQEVQQIILHTLEELRKTVEGSSKETYTKAELIQLLEQVSDIMGAM